MTTFRRTLAASAVLCLAWMVSAVAPANACTTPCTKSQITTDINTNWPDNTAGAITPALLRSTVLELLNSYFDLVGLGTGVQTALGVNVGSAGAFVVNGGALGTPSSGNGSNLTALAAANLTGQLLAAQFPALTGDVTTSAGSLATTIGPGIVTNAKLAASMPAYTFKCNNTASGSQTPTDCDATTFTLKPSPVSADLVIIQDSAALNAYKRTTVGAIATIGSVASIGGLAGTVGAGAGLTTCSPNSICVSGFLFGPQASLSGAM